MENQDYNKRLSLNEMQNLLPDYVFGRASESDKLQFENSLVLYPELQKEIADVNEVFRKLESFDPNKVIDQRTRNLSVKVNSKLNAKYSRNSGMFFFRYLAPVLGVVVVLFFVYKTNVPIKKVADKSSAGYSAVTNTTIKKPAVNSVNKSDLNLKLKNTGTKEQSAWSDTKKPSKAVDLYDLKPEMAYMSQINMTNDDFGNMTINDINDYLLDQIIDETNGLNLFQTNGNYESEQDMMKQLNNIDEKDINNIIEELQNANV